MRGTVSKAPAAGANGLPGPAREGRPGGRLGLGARAGCRSRGPQPEPLRIVADATSAATTRPIVIRCRRRGVSHAQRRVANQLRAVLALATAVVAPIMHCMHMPSSVCQRGERGGDALARVRIGDEAVRPDVLALHGDADAGRLDSAGFLR